MFRHDAGEIAPAFDVPHEDEFGTEVLGFERDGAHYLMSSSVGRDTGALFRVDAATGERQLLADDPRSDLVSCLRDPQSNPVPTTSSTARRAGSSSCSPASRS